VDLLVDVEQVSVFDNGVGSGLLPVPHVMVVVSLNEQSEWCFQGCCTQSAKF
jgi:hypothetical protein